MDYRSDNAPIHTPFGEGPRLVLRCVRPVQYHGVNIIEKGDVVYGWLCRDLDGFTFHTPHGGAMSAETKRFLVESEEGPDGHDDCRPVGAKGGRMFYTCEVKR